MEKDRNNHWILQKIIQNDSSGKDINLWPQIERRLISDSKVIQEKRNTSPVKTRSIMKRILVYSAAAIMGFAILSALIIPPVRAQVTEWVNHQVGAFSFITPHQKVAVSFISNGNWGFIPLSPTYLPCGSWITVPDSFQDQASGVEILKLTINEDNHFVILTERKLLPGEGLPAGVNGKVGDELAIITSGLSGIVDAGIPRDSDGGVLPEESGMIRLKPIQYTGGIRLLWQTDKIRLEILSNLPLKKVMKIAGSLEPVAVEPAEIIISEPQ